MNLEEQLKLFIAEIRTRKECDGWKLYCSIFGGDILLTARGNKAGYIEKRFMFWKYWKYDQGAVKEEVSMVIKL